MAAVVIMVVPASHTSMHCFFTTFYKLSVTCYKTFLLYLITLLSLLALLPSIVSPLPNLYVSGANRHVLKASSWVLCSSCCSHAAMAMILSCIKFLSCIMQSSIFFFSSFNFCSYVCRLLSSYARAPSCC